MTTNLKQAAVDRLERARLWVLEHLPFYGALLFGLADKVDSEPRVKTAATNGREIIWCSEYVASIRDSELRAVLVHEVAHCAHGHLWRLPADEKGNEAGDYAINAILRKLETTEFGLPRGVLYEKRFDGMPEELIYAELVREKEKNGQTQNPQGGGSNGSGTREITNPCGEFVEPADGIPRESAGNGPREREADSSPVGDEVKDRQAGKAGDSLQGSWERRVIAAVLAEQANGRGAEAGAAAEAVLRRVNRRTKLDWRAETADWLRTSCSRTKADWSRPARRHAWQRVVYASRKADAVGDIVAIRDTSGSIGATVVAEFNDILRQLSAEIGCGIRVIDSDARIRADYGVIAAGEPLPGRAVGGGGTDFEPGLARARDLVSEGGIAAVVYLTDGYGCGTECAVPDVGAPLLWVSTAARLATGRTVLV